MSERREQLLQIFKDADPRSRGELKAEIERLTRSRDGYAKQCAARAEECDRLRRERDEALGELKQNHVDERGTTWTRCWAWAYYATCRSRDSWQARAKAAEARVAKLREALEPFAERANRYDAVPSVLIGDSVELWQIQSNKGMHIDISVGHLRAARAALAQPKEGQADG